MYMVIRDKVFLYFMILFDFDYCVLFKVLFDLIKFIFDYVNVCLGYLLLHF